MKLTTAKCKAMKPTGKTYRRGDGGGLYLVCTGRGGKSWMQRIRYGGTRHDLGLGPFDLVSLSEARKKSIAMRKDVFDGIDPRESKKGEGITFREAADLVIKERAPGLTERVAKSWTRSMEIHAYPLIGDMPVGEVDMPDIKKVLMPLRGTSSLLGTVARRISAILQWAIVMRHRALADQTEIVVNSLPRSNNGREHQSHASIHHREVNAAIVAVNATKVLPSAKAAFALLCLTACRSSEVLGARWDELDLDAAIWTIPAERMKMRKEHRVPLAKQAIVVLKAARTLSKGDLVFPGMKGQLAERALRNALASAGVKATGHGFRTSFSDWCRETGAQADVRERALAHGETNKVQASYTVSDLLDQRRIVMQKWADHIMP